MRAAFIISGAVTGLIVAAVLGVVLVVPLSLARAGGPLLAGVYSHLGMGMAGARSAPSAAPSPPGRGFGFGGTETAHEAYLGSCAQCHGADGDGGGPFGRSTDPPATNLASHDTQEKSDAELFWIIKNGVSFSAMPGYATEYQDAEIMNMVDYVRSLAKAAPPAIQVPAPTSQQLASANPSGSSAIERGTAVYYAQACQDCHGATGNAPGQLALRDVGEANQAIRRGRPGMPAYGTDKITEAELNDVIAYMRSWPRPSGGARPFERGG
jgi:mono/diheme cytochrome c family protein